MSTTQDLREIRKARGLTLQQAAAAAGLDPSNLSRIERGESIPQPERAIRLESALGIESADGPPGLAVYASILARFTKSQKPQFLACGPQGHKALDVCVAQHIDPANDPCAEPAPGAA